MPVLTESGVDGGGAAWWPVPFPPWLAVPGAGLELDAGLVFVPGWGVELGFGFGLAP
ncbi:hypothetical protein [Amycolatopsis sp. cg13]|uniref:hypothetical protein n=1 Tax=Amycolatopsis sp. cg13 TaxID=3238807 RepID=UPI003526999A